MFARVRKFSLIFILYSLLGGWVSAQRLPDSGISKIPLTGLSDDEAVLGNDSSLQRQVIESLQELDRKHGCCLIVVLKGSVIGVNASDYSSRLQEKWLPDGGGSMLVFEANTSTLGVGRGSVLETGQLFRAQGGPAAITKH